MKLGNIERGLFRAPSGFDLSLIAFIIVFNELLARLEGGLAHDRWYFITALFEFLEPVLLDFAFQLVLLLVNLAELGSFRIQLFKLLNKRR